MMCRKSKFIGKVINGYLIKDSKHIGNDTKLLVECQKCGNEEWKSRGFIKNSGKCPYCDNGRNYHNAKGYEHERLYERYISLLRRVKGHEHYKNVEVCQEWKNDYLSFRQWALENGYEDNLTIDRIDNSKGYYPDNCRWVDAKTQANNRTTNKRIEYNGETHTQAEWEQILGFPRNLITQRIRNGWSVERALSTPYRRKNDGIKN